MWNQRLTHKTISILDPAIGMLQGTTKPIIENVGLIAILCHLICAGTMKNVSLPKKGQAVRIIVGSLASDIFYKEEAGAKHVLWEVKRLAIASILTVACSSPGLVSILWNLLLTRLLDAFLTHADCSSRATLNQ